MTILSFVVIISAVASIISHFYHNCIMVKHYMSTIEDLKEDSRLWLKRYSELETMHQNLSQEFRKEGKIQAYLLDGRGITLLGPDDYKHVTRG